MPGKTYASHNDYLQYLVHHGLIGLIVFIMIFYKVFRQVWNQLQSTKDAWKKKLYLSYLAGFFGYTFAMMGVNVITPRYIFWFYTAIIYRYCHLEINKQT
jgi:O-antigen ligase